MAKTGMKNRQSITMSSVSAPIIPIKIVNADIPAQYADNADFDVRVAFNQLVTGLTQNNAHEVFLFEGAKMSQATPYKWIGDGEPDFDSPVDLNDWQILAVPDELPPPPSPPLDWEGTDEEWVLEWGFRHNYAFETEVKEWIAEWRDRDNNNFLDVDGTWRRKVIKSWHGEELRYLLLRFLVPAGTTGIFSMTFRSDGVLRGEMLKGRGYVGF